MPLSPPAERDEIHLRRIDIHGRKPRRDGLHQLPAARGARRRVESGGDDGNLHFVLHLRIDDRAEDDVRLFVRRFLDDRRRLVHFEEGHVRAAGDVDQHALGAFDRRFFQQR